MGYMGFVAKRMTGGVSKSDFLQEVIGPGAIAIFSSIVLSNASTGGRVVAQDASSMLRNEPNPNVGRVWVTNECDLMCCPKCIILKTP
jgi:hypothetical protein